MKISRRHRANRNIEQEIQTFDILITVLQIDPFKTNGNLLKV